MFDVSELLLKAVFVLLTVKGENKLTNGGRVLTWAS